MNKHSIVNLKCPCFLFRYPNLDKPSQALFNLHRASALPLWCGSEDDQNFQSPPGHSRQPVRRRRYCIIPVWHSDDSSSSKQCMCFLICNNNNTAWINYSNWIEIDELIFWISHAIYIFFYSRCLKTLKFCFKSDYKIELLRSGNISEIYRKIKT